MYPIKRNVVTLQRESAEKVDFFETEKQKKLAVDSCEFKEMTYPERADITEAW